MKKIFFAKMEGTGNDFIVLDERCGLKSAPAAALVRRLCDRKRGIGADGVLWLGRPASADVAMRIFNADGSEAGMCGNGARCCAFYESSRRRGKGTVSIQTQAGRLTALVSGTRVKLKMTDPTGLRRGIRIVFKKRKYEVDFINTGVPHAVIEMLDLEKAPVVDAGRFIRNHRIFAPEGTNVDFYRRKDDHTIEVRTYERGVEDETLACGTGAVASAIIAALKTSSLRKNYRVHVGTRSRQTLVVDFSAQENQLSDVWMEGHVRMVYRGEFYV